jgi:CubicO group peptidase (beta-lactamase class C family)
MSAVSAEVVASLDRLFEAACRSDQPGYVAGVAKDGKLLYRRAFGLASIEHAVANTPATRMRIGSTTKHFTSLAILLLAEDGKLDADTKLRTYLPELTGAMGEPTLRQLMNHMGGIRDPLEVTAFFLTEGLYPKLSVDIVYRWSQRFSRMNFPPGERWAYSNIGYTLLSFVIERVSGKTLSEFLHERIFVPLGMVDTALQMDDMKIVPGIASFHMPDAKGGYSRGIYPSELLGSGGIVSTVDDMLRWMAHLRQPDIVGRPETWAQFRSRPRFNSGGESDYCIGLMRQDHGGPELVHHAGATLGATCMMLTVPERALDMIVMSNRMDSDPTGLSMRIAEVVLGEPLRVKPSAAPLAGRDFLTGRYFSAKSGMLAELGAHGEQLSVSISKGPAIPATARAEGLLADSPIGPVTLNLGTLPPPAKLARIEISNCGIREIFERLPDEPPSPPSLAGDLTGSYVMEDFDTPVDIVIEEQSLFIDLRSRYQPVRLKLEPLSSEVLFFAGSTLGLPLAGTVVLERDRDTRVSGFSLTTGRTWNLHFSRRVDQ